MEPKGTFRTSTGTPATYCIKHGNTTSSNKDMMGDRGRAMRSYRYRLYPNKAQETVLISTLETCRRLYNNALVERKDAWKDEQLSVTYREQQDALPGNKDEYQ